MKCRLLVIAIASFLATSAAHAASLEALNQCKAISNDAERLACYDQLTADAVTEAETPKEENFGFEKQVAEKASPDHIVSSIDGEFTGWSGKTKFKLANGQVWQQTDRRKFRHRATNPEVVIDKGFLGAFYMRVDGLNRHVKVKRIK